MARLVTVHVANVFFHSSLRIIKLWIGGLETTIYRTEHSLQPTKRGFMCEKMRVRSGRSRALRLGLPLELLLGSLNDVVVLDRLGIL